MRFLLPVIIWLAVGAPAAWPFFRRRRWCLGLGVVPFAGCLALLGPMIVSAYTGMSTAGAWWIIEAVVVSCGLAGLAGLLDRTLAWRKFQPSTGEPAVPAALDKTPKTSAMALFLAGGVMLVVAAVNLYTGVIFTSGAPPYGWDALAQWLLTVKVLADSGAFPREYFVPGGQWEYPILMPSLLACFRRYGQMEILQLSFSSGVIAAVFPLAAWLGSWRRIGPLWAALAALTPFAVGRFITFHYGCYADSILVFCGLAGMIFGVIGIRDRDRLSLIAGSMALAAAAATKNEGVAWALSCCLMLGLYALVRGEGWRRAIVMPLAAGLVGAVFFAGWWGVCKSLHLQNEIVAAGSFKEAGNRVNIVLPAIGRHLVTGEWREDPARFSPLLTMWIRQNVPESRRADMGDSEIRSAAFWQHSDLLIWLPALAVMPLLAAGRIRRRLLTSVALLSGPGIYIAALAMVYLLTPKPLQWHMDTSLHRVMFIVPAAVVAAMTLVRASPSDAALSEIERANESVSRRGGDRSAGRKAADEQREKASP